jgi:hypothetical protein
MGRRDPRIDAYIAKAPEFARPILTRLRELVHEGCPEVEETLKWRMPSFQYHGILCGMAAFKAHATFGFWKGALFVDPDGRDPRAAMGEFGRLTSVRDLPAKRVLLGYVKQAMALNEAGKAVPRVRKHPKPALRMPADLRAALAKRKPALAAWAAFPPSAKRDYLEWVLGAKQPATRAKRVATAAAWIAAGKRRNWKYERA